MQAGRVARLPKGLVAVPKNYFSSGNAALKIRFLNRFDQKLSESQADHSDTAPKQVDASVKKAYTHPYHSERHPLHITAFTEQFAWEEVVGQEQASVHYVPFLHARKWLLGLFGGYVFLAFWADLGEYAYWAYHKNAHFWAINSIFFLEFRNHGLMPFPWLFYNAYITHEFNELKNAYTDKDEAAVDMFCKKATDQMEYYYLYKEFNAIKRDALGTWFVNEQKTLRKHVYDRALNILNATKKFESENKQKLVSQVKQDIATEIDGLFKGDKKKGTQETFFNLALEGIKQGRMEYGVDPVLDVALTILRRNSDKYTTLSAADSQKLLSLTPEQRQMISDSDKRLETEFLNKTPEFTDNRVKSLKTYKNKTANWGV